MSWVRRLGLQVAAMAINIAVGTVSDFEGKENSAYRDPVGMVTICYGHTETALIGQTQLATL